MKFLIIFILVAVTASVNGGSRPVPTPNTVEETVNESGISTDYDYDYEDDANGSEDTGESDGAMPEENEPEDEETQEFEIVEDVVTEKMEEFEPTGVPETFELTDEEVRNDDAPEETEPKGEETQEFEIVEDVVTEKMEEFEPTGVPETFELTDEEVRNDDASWPKEEHEEKTEESIEVVTKDPSIPKQPKKEAKSANPLSEQELQDYWRAYDNCVPKMRSELGGGLETKLRNGEYKDLGYYDKCTILCFLYDNWIVENYRLNQTKLERLLDGSGGNLQSTMSQCVKPLPVDCLIAYDIYSCFAEKGATIFFKTYTR